MISHILVFKAISEFLELRGYKVQNWAFKWTPPIVAIHPEHGEIEVYFYGENFTVDEDSIPIARLKWNRTDLIQEWNIRKTMMSEEAAQACVAQAVLLVLNKLATRTDRKRIALAVPDTHNFMKYLGPLVRPLASAGVEFFFVCSDLSIAPIGKRWDLPPAHEPGLLSDSNTE